MIVVLFALGGRAVVDRGVQPGGVEPVDPAGGLALDSERPAQLRGWASMSSVLYSPMVDSMRALSRASPTLPMDPAMPATTRASVNARDVYCDPASEWCTNPVAVNAMSARRRVNKACSRAEVTSGVAIDVDIRQPRIRRE